MELTIRIEKSDVCKYRASVYAKNQFLYHTNFVVGEHIALKQAGEIINRIPVEIYDAIYFGREVRRDLVEELIGKQIL